MLEAKSAATEETPSLLQQLSSKNRQHKLDPTRFEPDRKPNYWVASGHRHALDTKIEILGTCYMNE